MGERLLSAPPAHGDAAEALRYLYPTLLECWNRRDAAGFAARFAPEGNLVGFDGSQIDGARAIGAHLSGIFAAHTPASYVASVREVRLTGADVGLGRAVVGMVPPGQTRVNPAVNAIQSLVAHADGGTRRIQVSQNTPAPLHQRPEAVAALTEELQRQVRA